METSPPVRDVSERNRANRNKCIAVAVTSVLILAAVVVIISYITHFSSTELTTESASALIDKAISQSQNDSVIICNSFEIILKENETSLIERAGDCVEAVPAREDIDKRNETNDEPVPRSNITCKLSLSNVKITALSNSTKQFKECHVNGALEVEFVFNTENKVQNITIRQAVVNASSVARSRQGKDRDLIVDLQNIVERVLAEEILQLAAEYSTGDATVSEELASVNRETVCQQAPWECS